MRISSAMGILVAVLSAALSACTTSEQLVCDGDQPCTPIQVVCGDGNTNGNEECDDGNTQSGDGCDATCHAECNGGENFAHYQYNAISGECVFFGVKNENGTFQVLHETWQDGQDLCAGIGGNLITLNFGSVVFPNGGPWSPASKGVWTGGTWDGMNAKWVSGAPWKPTMSFGPKMGPGCFAYHWEWVTEYDPDFHGNVTVLHETLQVEDCDVPYVVACARPLMPLK